MNPPKTRAHVFIVSDSTGVTAERVISAALVQFKLIKPVIKRFPYVSTKKQLANILAKAEKLQAVVIFSLVSRELRRWIHEEEKSRNVHTIDLLGPSLERMGKLWNMTPAFRPGLFKGLGQKSMRLAAAIDFTLRHDDGRGIRTLGRADLIILGVSRTSKTPTSIYISCNNSLKVANCPIILNIKPPEKIFTLKRRKVGFTISPERLAFIRHKRLEYAGPTGYVDMALIREEIEYSHSIFRRIENLQVIDVTNRSIEETANLIVQR